MPFLPDDSKYITVARLVELTNELRPGDWLRPNRVGNLSIIRDGTSIGYIDLSGDGEIELHEPLAPG
jgi:hypothetical protein